MRSILGLLLFLPAVLQAQMLPMEPPMRIASQAPLQSLRLGLLPFVPAELERGEVRAALSGTWTNIWINDLPNVLLDYEALDSRLTVGWGLSESTQLEIGIEERSAFGGLLDPFIQNFHHQIGNGLNGRDTVPRGTVHIEVRDPDSGEWLVRRYDPGPFSRGLSATIARTAESPHGRLAYATTLRIPLRHAGEELSSAPDAGISAAWSRDVRGRSIHLGGGMTWFGTGHVDGVRVQRLQRTGFAAIAQPLTPRTALILQYLFSEGIAPAGALGRNAHEVSVGGRVRMSGNTAIEIGVIENFINYDNGPDFGIHMAVVRSAL